MPGLLYILRLQTAEAVVQRCSFKKVFLQISQNSHESNCARVCHLIKVQVKKRPWHKCFPVNFAKILRTPAFIKHLRWLLLKMLSAFLFYFISSICLTFTNFESKESWQNNIIYLLNDGGSCLTETSPFICSANQWTGFYVIGITVMKELN